MTRLAPLLEARKPIAAAHRPTINVQKLQLPELVGDFAYVFTVIYNWKIDPKLEVNFLRAWRARTIKIQKFLGSYGSRLYRAENGTYVAIALWPSRQQWDSTQSKLPDDGADAEIFAKAVVEHLSTQLLTMVDDLWDFPRTELGA